MDAREQEQLLTQIENMIERIEELEELAVPESQAVTSRRTLTPAEIELSTEFEVQASELLDPEAYAEIAPFSVDDETTYEEYWDRLRELRAALEEQRDALRKTWLRPTEYPDSPDEELTGGPRAETPESDDLD